MATQLKQWQRVRHRILERRESIRHVAQSESLSRNTVRKILRSKHPQHKATKTKGAMCGKLNGRYGVLLNALLNQDQGTGTLSGRDIFYHLRDQGYTGSYASVMREIHRTEHSRGADAWRQAVSTLRMLPMHEAICYLRSIVGRTSRLLPVPSYRRGLNARKIEAGETIARSWFDWLQSLEKKETHVSGMQEDECDAALRSHLVTGSRYERPKSLVVLALKRGFSMSEIVRALKISRNTIRRYDSLFRQGGVDLLFAPQRRTRLSDDEPLKKAIFTLLHEPPAQSGFNRTTWKMADLQRALVERGHSVCLQVIRSIVNEAGFKWRSARTVLTSNDPHYREKLDRVQQILSNLSDNERFFSIDEYGPFAIKMKGGRTLAPPGTQPMVPQWQKSKGWLIMTAALELSRNQVTHFYSQAKNTAEMLKMTKVLLQEYREASRLYLSWDAASWHMSKQLTKFINDHNAQAEQRTEPFVELVPLPARAQFLNVIESVFSGMARAIIHNSNYGSKEEAIAAIDRYFLERNQHFKDQPRHAGNKIWKRERTSAEFDPSNNCKDPAYR